MKQSKLKNKASKMKNPLEILKCKDQGNYVTKLTKTVKLEYLNNSKLSKDNKTFWGSANFALLITDTDTMINEKGGKGELLLKNKDVADKNNKYFGFKRFKSRLSLYM